MKPLDKYRSIIDTQLAVSRDGVEWERAGTRAPFMTNGPPGSVDRAQVYCESPRRMGDELWFYYGAMDGDHSEPYRRGNICLAKLRLDGFVSIDAGGDVGMLLTTPFVCEGGPLFVNASARGGGLSVAVLDEQGVEMDGYRRTDCALFDGDSVRQRMTWRGGITLDALAGSVVRLKFYVRSAKLYSFALGEGAGDSASC